MTDGEALTFVATRYLQVHPAQRPAVMALVRSLEAGTLIPANVPAVVTALTEAITVLQQIQTTGLPALITQLTALKTRGTVVAP